MWTFDVAADGRILTTHTPGRDHVAVLLNEPDEVKRIETSGVGR